MPTYLPEDRVSIIEPSHRPGLSDEKAAVLDALEHPIVARPLRQWIKPGARICIAFTDLTRATPNERIILWLLEHLGDVPREQFILLNQLGTHRPNTRKELEHLLTPEVVRNYRIINHEPLNPNELVQFGTTADGAQALINRHLAQADVRIITGLIEPHFFAGFSGGVKGIVPGCAGLKTVMSNHGARNIGHPQATFGITEGNPLWEELRDIALRAGPSFLLNVTLNERRQITGVFAGDILQAHKAGCEFVRASAKQKVATPFDIVVTSNSGYPLDLNLYHGVKGMSAAARILKQGGTLILVCECREGVPAGSPFDTLLRGASSPDEILAMLNPSEHARPEQWQVQLLVLIQRKAKVWLYSSFAEGTSRVVFFEPCRDISATVSTCLNEHGAEARVAVLPQGPLTIPYLG